MLLSSRSAISFWIVGDDVDINHVAELARQVSHVLSWPVVIQPGRLDPVPSNRPDWSGRSGTIILNQLLQRHQPGCLVNFGITADHISSSKRDDWMFGYAYMDFPAACMSLKPLEEDAPSVEQLIHRAMSVCLHEIAHTLGLEDHYDEAGCDCIMHGTVIPGAVYPSDFCHLCLPQIRTALKAIHDDGTGFVPTIGATFAGRYLLRRFIDQGGMGVVWQALDIPLAQTVAVKFVESRRFDGKRQVQLVAEAAKTRLLSHPNIVRVFDLARDAGTGALIMNWVDGESLEKKRKARRCGRFGTSEIRTWIQELCRAVACAHRRQILHLDIKPQNCLIDGDGHLMLTDFGVAKMECFTSGKNSALHTRGRGTPGYAAPEQLAGSSESVAQDIHAIGATIYCLLAGHPPGMEAPADPKTTLLNLRGGAPPREWIETVSRCLDPEPAKRPASVDQIMHSLKLGNPESDLSPALRWSFWQKFLRWAGILPDV